ncbi:chorismate mutase family protein [Streptomyces sp. NPDC053542]|uniref:chorismate mutase family protein n=1 Tax=Streptomyces sp. NPDC053542 TaxID=3365710 RepID=UPI0037D49F80
MTHVPATSQPASDTLEALRAELDATDTRLRDALRERIEICVRIAEHKRQHGIPMMQPHRIGAVQDRAARFAEEHGIDQTFIRRFYDLIITETCRVEDLVIAGEEPK